MKVKNENLNFSIYLIRNFRNISIIKRVHLFIMYFFFFYKNCLCERKLIWTIIIFENNNALTKTLTEGKSLMFQRIFLQ